MNEAKRALKYLLITAVIFITCFFCFTVGGISRIYDAVLRLNSNEINSTNKIINDKSDYEDIKAAKIIMIGQTGDTDIDSEIQREMISFLSEYSDANCIVTDIGNSEAGMLNAYLETGNEEYYLCIENSSEKEFLKNERFYDTIKELYNANQIKPDNEKFYFAGIAPDINEALQLEYIEYLFAASSENPLNETIASYTETSEQSALELAEKLRDGMTAYTGMFKEHFLSDYSKLEYAVDSIINYDERTEAENFINIYRDRMVAEYILLLDENMINPAACGKDGFINKINAEIPLLRRRSYTIDSFICGEDTDKIRVVNSESMKYIDMYTSFVYRMAGKVFSPTPYETSKYYIRIG